MTPLSEALTAAQRSALAALEKAYVAGQIVDVHFVEALNSAGITDPVDIAFLMASLDVLREWGVAAPTMTERVAEVKVERSSQKQRDYIRSLAQEKNVDLKLGLEDLTSLTKAQASQVIEELQAGAYDPAKYSVPF